MQLPLKIRTRIFRKLAQAQPAPAAADPNAPTTETTPTVIAPQSFNMVSGTWAWVTKVYNAPTVKYLNTIFNILHVVMHYGTEGKHNLLIDQNGLANVDSSSANTFEGENAILFAQLLHRTFLNEGHEFKPTPTQINDWVDEATSSSYLLNLDRLNPTGPAARKLAISGSMRQVIVDNLRYIKQYNPIEKA